VGEVPVSTVRTFCIRVTDPTYGEFGPRTDRARRLREQVGVYAETFWGLHAPHLGIESWLPYTLNGPPTRPMSQKSVGTWLSHRALWAACLLTPDDEFLILEDDALFPSDWSELLASTLLDAPTKWDLINFGACCAADKPKRHVRGSLYVVQGGPMCFHTYLVRRSARRVLKDSQDEARCYAPIDISVMMHSLPRLRAYAVLPRIVEQIDFPTLAH
jgi:hypothetical protein